MLDNHCIQKESKVRSYCNNFPKVFQKAAGNKIEDQDGNTYIDFLSGCGSLNYGHNHPVLKEVLLDYIASDGIAMSLDMYTASKEDFIECFFKKILFPKGLNYRVQFPGPTGANAIEAAIKLARKVTGRTNIIAFTNGFHGCSLGALSLTGSSHHRASSVSQLNNVTRMPYDGYLGSKVDTASILEQMLSDPSGGVDAPAAIILEVIQGEGGLNTASSKWMQSIAKIANKHGALLIVDEIQSGCGRSGDFFAFEALGVNPDIITLAKSISGYGLPMSLVLVDPKYDQWKPGEHNGTFRGNNHAFVTAKAALDIFWSDDLLSSEVRRKSNYISERLHEIAKPFGFKVKGRGMMQGIDVKTTEDSLKIRQICFENNLILEACGPADEIIKLLPPLTISDSDLEYGLEAIGSAMQMIQFSEKIVA